MTPKRKQRIILAALGLLAVSSAVAIALSAFEDNLLYFFSPTEIQAGLVPDGAKLRVGGVVRANSVQRSESGLDVAFAVSDGETAIPVHYTGILPDLFRECQTVIAEGVMGEDGAVRASRVLAKHDENYQPPELADMVLEAEMQRCGDAS